jgi:hypothetical protein
LEIEALWDIISNHQYWTLVFMSDYNARNKHADISAVGEERAGRRYILN